MTWDAKPLEEAVVAARAYFERYPNSIALRRWVLHEDGSRHLYDLRVSLCGTHYDVDAQYLRAEEQYLQVS